MESPLPPSRSPANRLSLLVLILAGGTLAGLWYWRNPTPDEVLPVAQQRGVYFNCVSISPGKSGRALAAVDTTGRLRLWEMTRPDLPQRELAVTLPSKWPLHDVAWLPDGVVLTGGFERHVLAWNPRTRKATKLPMFPAEIVSLAAHPLQGEFLLSLSNGSLLRAKLSQANLETVQTGHSGVVKVVRYRPDGKRFVTGGVDKKLIWHDARTLDVLKTVTAHDHEICTIAYDKSGNRLATGSWDNTVKTWSDEGFEQTHVLQHPTAVATVAWMDTDVVSTAWDHRLRIWNALNGQMSGEQAWDAESLAFAVWPDERRIVGIKQNGDWLVVKP